MKHKDHMVTSWGTNRRDIDHDEFYEQFEKNYERRGEGTVLLNGRRVIVFEPFLEEDGKTYLNLFGEFKLDINKNELEGIRIAHEGLNFGQSEKIAFILDGPDIIGSVTYLDEEGMKIYEEKRINKPKKIIFEPTEE